MKVLNSSRPAATFRALGHPARVTVVRALARDGETCACDLVKACGLGGSTVSRHLSVLREAGVIRSEKRGLQIFYTLARPCIARFIDCLEHPRRYPELHESVCCR